VSTFDVTLLDDAGTEIAAVQEFTLRRVDGLVALAAPVRERRDAARTSLPGLSPAEGADAFLRVLAGINFPQIVVSRSVPSTAAGSALPSVGVAAAPSPAPATRRNASQTPYVAPRNEIERAVGDLWGEQLGIADIGVFDNFFELGGHSVLALQLISRLRDAFGIDLPLDVLFEAPSVAELADLILRRLGEGTDATELDAALAEIAGLSDEEVRALVAGQPQPSEADPTW
jgi:acyl carrier protein